MYKANRYDKHPEKTCHLWTGSEGDSLWLRIGEVARIEVMFIIHEEGSWVGGPVLGPVFIDQKENWYVPLFYFDQNYDEDIEFLKDVLCPCALR